MDQSPDPSSANARVDTRLDPDGSCPCDSGMTFGHCCLPDLDYPNFDPDDEIDQLDALTSLVSKLVTAGRLDLAERLCEELKRRWPDTIKWRGAYALLHEARGDAKRAAAHWRLVVDFARSHGGFDERGIQQFLEHARRLDP